MCSAWVWKSALKRPDQFREAKCFGVNWDKYVSEDRVLCLANHKKYRKKCARLVPNLVHATNTHRQIQDTDTHCGSVDILECRTRSLYFERLEER